MADLVVDTRALYAAGMELSQVAAAVEDLGRRGGRWAALVPAVGRAGAAAAVAAFGQTCLYAAGWIGTQALEASRHLLLVGAAFAQVEQNLAAAAGGGAAAVHLPPCASGPAAPPPSRPNWALLAPAGTSVPVQLSSATHVRQLIPGDPEEVRTLGRSLTDVAEEFGRARS
ncbi:MAG: hypothetical protein ACT4QG_19265, partial [Sporichthyaceae bacterium]